MKATIRDIAARAGVSTATVDRVLNGRSGVKAKSRHQVLQAAQMLGYLPHSGETSLPTRPAKLEFIIPVGTNRFLAELARHIEAFSATLPLVSACKVHRLNSVATDAMISAIDRLDLATAGLGIVAVDSPRLRLAVTQLTDAGLRVVTIASDMPSTPRANYVGIDNRSAGRTVGLLMGRMLDHRREGVAVILGARLYRGHEEREAGFRSVFAEEFPDIDIIATHEVADESSRSYQEAQSLFVRHPNLAGVYCAGGGRGGVLRAVAECFPDARPRIFCHELSDNTREALLAGTLDIVVDQNASLMAEQAVIHLLGSLTSSVPYLTKRLIQPRIITRENIPVHQ